MPASSCHMAACRPHFAGSGMQRPAHAGLVARLPVAHQRTRGRPAADRKFRVTVCKVQTQTASRGPQLRFIQHKEEARVFYRFLSIVYDHIVNPGHWTVDMRDDALEPAKLDDPGLKVVDVGGGTGFCTQGVVKTVPAHNVTLIDQSPHQLEKARKKADLQGVTIVEAYRVIKPGGLACLIGPVHPTFWLSRFFADVWMLFPTEDEYMEWFTKAGFQDVRIKRIGPKWYRGVRRHGLIMGCSVTGVKTQAGDSPLQMGPKLEASGKSSGNPFAFLGRFVLGTLAGGYYFVLPIYMWLKNLVWPRGLPGF